MKSIIVWFLLPFALIAGAILRPSFISLLYVLLALVGPLLPAIPSSSIIAPGSIRFYLIVSLLISISACITQFVYQLVESIIHPNIEIYSLQCNASTINFWLRQFGLIRLKGDAGFDRFRVISPEVIATFASFLATMIFIFAFKKRNVSAETEPNVQRFSPRTIQSVSSESPCLVIIKKFSDILVVASFGLVGIIQACLLNSVYFLSFLVILTLWASLTPIRRATFNGIKTSLIAFAAVHLIVLYVYQIPVVESILPSSSLPARLFGFVSLSYSDCNNWWSLKLVSNNWTDYANIVLIYIFYNFVIVQYRWTYDGTVYFDGIDSGGSSVHEELLASSTENSVHGEQKDEISSSFNIDYYIVVAFFSGIKAFGANSVHTAGLVFSLIVHNFYSITLAAMMIWALLFHSIFGLAFLIIACFLWVLKDTRKFTLKLSPIIIAYVELLLIFEYIYSMDLPNELPKTDLLKIIGFSIAESRTEAFFSLLIKAALSIPLFILLRLHMRQMFYKSLNERERLRHINYGTFARHSAERADLSLSQPHTPIGMQTMQILSEVLVKYWIVLVFAALLSVTMKSPPVFYSIIYFLFFSILLIFVRLSIPYFCSLLYLVLTLLVVFSSLLLVVIYCYQFPAFPAVWKNFTHLSDKWNHDIGLINYKEEGDSSSLFVCVLGPLLLFVVVMLHLKFFHNAWIRLVKVRSERLEDRENSVGIKRFLSILNEIVEFLWNFIELHVNKFVLFILVLYAVKDVCALNLFVMVFVSLSICLPGLAQMLSFIAIVYLSFVGIMRMTYQLNVIPENITNFGIDCNFSKEESHFKLSEWIGFRKSADHVGTYMAGIVISIILLAIEKVIYYRQVRRRLSLGLPYRKRGVIFADENPSDWDKSLLNMCKFMVDYCFYKFGLEIAMIMMVVVAWNRMDFLGTVLLVWLFIFCTTSRETCRRLWKIFFLYLAVLFSLQYLFYIGLPPALCIDPFWNYWLSNPIQNDNLLLWLDLLSLPSNINTMHSLFDLILLIMVACQNEAFGLETQAHAAGDNKSIYKDGVHNLFKNNPKYDFVANQRNFVDLIKIVIFTYGHWVTITMIMAAGLGGVSLFALGYIILGFWMLWQGTDLYLMINFKKTLKQWNIALIYTVFAMFCKLSLQIVGCVFIQVLQEANLCYIRQLFSIVCVDHLPENYYFPTQLDFDNSCPVQKSETQIGFDTFAFAFIVFQIRILNSWYFQHCIIEFRSQEVLMSRGAILKNQLIEKEMKEQNNHQEKVFSSIKQRTAAIRQVYEMQQSQTQTFAPESYVQAKRAGDYYMFDYDPSIDELVKPAETVVPEVTPGASDFKKLDPAQLVHTAVQRDFDLAGTLTAVETAEEIEDEEQRMIRAVSREDDKDDVDMAATRRTGVRFVWSRCALKVLTSALGWMAALLNRISREHRYVAYVLAKEKENLKSSLKEQLVDIELPFLSIRDRFDDSNLHCISSERDIHRLETEAHQAWSQHNILARLLLALGNCFAANTDLLCYLFAIMNHARCGGILSMPLPLLVFLWGSLANPRPNKLFWIVMIAYTETCVIIKFICQFGFFPWNETSVLIKNANNPSFLPGILGIRKEDFYAFWDIVLLIGIFFHRYMQRKLGLWNNADMSDTFLVEASNDCTQADSSDADGFREPLSVENPEADSDEQKEKRNVISEFFHRLLYPKFRYIRDLYPFMFFFDVACFFIVSFGYSSFGYGGSGSVLKDISSNRVPVTFVAMLIIITIMIVIDRALYLRKAVLCKLIYQLITTIFLHLWIFFILPKITYQPVWLNATAQLLYIVKCVYLLISAWQIRNGYPILCIGNLITHAYGLSNMVLFKVFMAVPFLFELRTTIDWTWTDTSMPLFDFFNMENFYASIYNLKCARTFEQRFPAPRGVPKGVVVKYFMGVPMILLLILIIWLPLLAFSLLNRIGRVLQPVNVQMTISVEGYPPLYKIEAQGIDLGALSFNEYNFIRNGFSERFNSTDQESVLRARQAVAFIDEYTPTDIMKVRFRPESESFWDISSDSLLAMKYELEEGGETINALLKLQFERPRVGDSVEPVSHSSTVLIPLEKNSLSRNNLIDVLNGSDPNKAVILKHAFPPFLIIPNEGELKAPPTLLAVMNEKNTSKRLDENYMNIVLKLKAAGKLWTAELVENNASSTLMLPFDYVKYETEEIFKYVQLIAFVDRVFPTFLTKYVQGGIIAMYLAVVMLVGRLVRGVFTSSPLGVIIAEIPNPDSLLKICLDIYLVREAKDFILEQDLFAKLVFLFRSPETLIKWTRYKAKAD